jgi:hypothetical protein
MAIHKYFVIEIFTLVLILAGCNYQSQKSKAAIIVSDAGRMTLGKIECKEKTIDVGIIRRDSVIITNFQLSNAGTESIRIIEFSVSCGCTSAHIADSLIMPGKSTIFTMKIDTKGKHPGPLQTDAVLITNGQHKYCKLTTKYLIKR